MPRPRRRPPVPPGSRPAPPAASATPAARTAGRRGGSASTTTCTPGCAPAPAPAAPPSTSLPGLNPAGQPACTRCSGIPARFRCGCGREVTAGERGRCWWCVLTGLVTDTLTGPGGQVPPGCGRWPTGWCPCTARKAASRGCAQHDNARDLAGPGRDRMPCSHAALDSLGTGRAVEYLRLLLVRYGVLPPRDRRLADFQRWAAAKLHAIGNEGHRQLLNRFLLAPAAPPAVGHHCGAARPRPLPAGQAAPHRGDRVPGLAGWPRRHLVTAPSTTSTRRSAPVSPPGGTSSPSCPGPASSAFSATSRSR